MMNNASINENQPLLSLQREWQTLHTCHEKYEYFSLVIKLFTVAVCLSSYLFSLSLPLTLSFIFILWLQEGIWKTFQARTCTRIESIEKIIQHLALKPTESAPLAFQFYSQWQESRPGTLGLVVEYIKSALRPTVAYPYALLLMLSLVNQVIT